MDILVDESEMKDMITEAGEAFLYHDVQEELIHLQNDIHDENVSSKGSKTYNDVDVGADGDKCEDDEDDDNDNNCLVIDEDRDSESDRTQNQRILHNSNFMHFLVDQTQNVEKGLLNDSFTLLNDKIPSRNNLCHDHDYCFNADGNRSKVVNSNNVKEVSKNKNVVVMQNPCVEGWDLQQSIRKRNNEDPCNVTQTELSTSKKLKRVEGNTNNEINVCNDKVSVNFKSNGQMVKTSVIKGSESKLVKCYKIQNRSGSHNVILAYLGGQKNFVEIPSGMNVDLNADKTKTSLQAGSLKPNMKCLRQKPTDLVQLHKPNVDTSISLTAKTMSPGGNTDTNLIIKTSDKCEQKAIKSVLDRRKIKSSKVPNEGQISGTTPVVNIVDVSECSKTGSFKESRQFGNINQQKAIKGVLDRHKIKCSKVSNERQISVTTPEVELTGDVIKGSKTGSLKDIGACGNINEQKAIKGVLDRRKIRCSKVSKKGLTSGTSAVVQLVDVCNGSKTGSLKDAGPSCGIYEISDHAKETDTLLKKQINNSTLLRKGTEMSTNTTGGVKPYAVEKTQIGKDRLGSDEVQNKSPSEKSRVPNEVLVTREGYSSKIASSEAEIDNPFDGYILRDSGTDRIDVRDQDNNIDIVNNTTDPDGMSSDDKTPGTATHSFVDPEAYTVEVKVLVCEECCSVFNNVTDYDKHLQTCQVDSKKSKICGVCRVAFPDVKTLHTHECKRDTDCVKYMCYLCKKKFMKRDVVLAHMKIHSEPKEFICEICQKSFLHKHHLVTHMDSHTDFRPYRCQVCPAAFKRSSHLQKHQLRHGPVRERKFKCRHCDMSFFDNYKRERHEKVHSSSPKKFVCEICNGMFWEKYILKRHMLKVHFDDSNGNKTSSKSKRQFKCGICGAVYYWKKHLDTHMTSHSDDVINSNMNVSNVSDCDNEKADDDLSNKSAETDNYELTGSVDKEKGKPCSTRASSKRKRKKFNKNKKM